MTLLELLQLLKKHLRLVIVLPLVCALVAGAYSFLIMKNTYSASTSMYVLVKDDSTGQSVSSSDLSASQMVTNDVAALLSSDRVINQTAQSLGLENLDAFKTSVTSETTSRVLTLTVSGTRAEDVARVANGMADAVSEVAQEVMDVSAVNVIDSAQQPANPSGPNRTLYVAVGLMGGLFLAVAVVVLMDMLNTKVRGQEDLEELLGIPVIGRVPLMREGM